MTFWPRIKRIEPSIRLMRMTDVVLLGWHLDPSNEDAGTPPLADILGYEQWLSVLLSVVTVLDAKGAAKPNLPDRSHFT